MDYSALLLLLLFQTFILSFGELNGVQGDSITNKTEIESNNTITPKKDVCEQVENLNFIRDQTNKYKQCISSIENKLFPFNCTQYKTIVNCFHDYTDRVHNCFPEMQNEWDITNKILTDAVQYLCDPKNELLHTFYSHGGKYCMSERELHHCGNSGVTTLLNNSQYSVFSKQLLAQNYSIDTCSEENDNAQCALNGISLYCKEQPNITLIAEKIHQIVMTHRGCSSSSVLTYDIRVNINILILILLATIVTSKLILKTT